MPRIRIKDHGSRQSDRKRLLWNRLLTFNLLVYKLEESNRNFTIITSDEVVDKLLTKNIRETLMKANFEVTTPPEYTANRTVVLRNIEALITSVENEELKQDIERRNDWAKISEIIKIPNAPKILKLRMENTDMVKRATENGMLLYNQSVPAYNISKEIYVYLEMCYICYSYDHKTTDCPTPELKVCSECGNHGHRYRQCTNLTKKCLNCAGEHRTMAARCPTRKQLLKNKEKEIRERSRSQSRQRTTSYAQVVKNDQQQHQFQDQQAMSSREDYIKVISSIQYAHMIEGIVPGSFHHNIREMYRLNGLPPVKFPEYIPPPNVDPSQINEEIRKIKESMGIRVDREVVDTRSLEMETEVDIQAKKRPLSSPTEDQQDRQVKPRQEDQISEDLSQEGAVSLPIASSPNRDPRQRKVEGEKEKEQTPNKNEREIQYDRQVQDMNIICVKTKATALKRGDTQELRQLVNEGKMKFVYSNPAFKDQECKAAWDRGLVHSRLVEIKTVSKEWYSDIINGQLVRERRSSTSMSQGSRTRQQNR